MTDHFDDLSQRLRRADPYPDDTSPSVLGTAWGNELETAILGTPADSPRRRRHIPTRRVAIVAVACAVVASGAALAALTRDSPPPTPDFDRAPITQETRGGYDLSLAAAASNPDALCLVARTPTGQRLSGCGSKTDVSTTGAQIVTRTGDGPKTVIGYAPEHANGEATLASSTVPISPNGFFVITGPPGAPVTMK